MHHVIVSTVDPKYQNSLVCGENVTDHVFGGKKTQSNQTGGYDWIRNDTCSVIRMDCKTKKKTKPLNL